MADVEQKAIVSKESSQLEIASKIVLEGNIAGLSTEEKVKYVNNLCRQYGLNPHGAPFKIMRFRDGKESLYADRGGAAQIRTVKGVSTKIVSAETDSLGIRTVRVQAILPSGRTEDGTGSVSVAGLKGVALENAYMKAETKAKRRATLDLIGLGCPDESELDSIDGILSRDVLGGNIEKPPPQEIAIHDEASVRKKFHRDAVGEFSLEASTTPANISITKGEKIEGRMLGEFPLDTLRKLAKSKRAWINSMSEPPHQKMLKTVEMLEEIVLQREERLHELDNEKSDDVHREIEDIFSFEKEGNENHPS